MNDVRRRYAAATIEHGWSRIVLAMQIEAGAIERQGNDDGRYRGTRRELVVISQAPDRAGLQLDGSPVGQLHVHRPRSIGSRSPFGGSAAGPRDILGVPKPAVAADARVIPLAVPT